MTMLSVVLVFSLVLWMAIAALLLVNHLTVFFSVLLVMGVCFVVDLWLSNASKPKKPEA
ncbi:MULTISPECIES: hypothetical protein [Paraburkholderia]|uniref:hypothetical protein n=1 Tax=Paraburkholderia TaxID=1822464 RepID=UPI00225B4732|nr:MULTISPECIES: hypothetical protein [Paraburkholderia]